MFECEIWLDIEHKEEGPATVACTLFARHSFPVRPCVGEGLSFHPGRDAKHNFHLVQSWGPMPASQVSVEVEEVGHYRAPGTSFSTSLRCSPVQVPSIQDANTVVAFLCEQHGFEVDPYGVNKLEE
jgi:hypothetical protein